MEGQKSGNENEFKSRTNIGHAPLSIQSWKSFQSVNPYYVLS